MSGVVLARHGSGFGVGVGIAAVFVMSTTACVLLVWNDVALRDRMRER